MSWGQHYGLGLPEIPPKGKGDLYLLFARGEGGAMSLVLDLLDYGRAGGSGALADQRGTELLMCR